MESVTSEIQMKPLGTGFMMENSPSSSETHTNELQSETSPRNNNNSNDNKAVTYFGLLKNNVKFRLFMISYFVEVLGMWLTYIASIDFIESHQNGGLEQSSQHSATFTGSILPPTNLSRTDVSILVVVRLLPNVLLSFIGGTLADAYDRRILMIYLDFAGAACSLLFVLAFEMNSVLLIYIASFLQQGVAGLYQPSASSIIPLLVNGDEELKKATTMESLCWSAMTAFGAAASGVVVGFIGIRMCFLLDAATFFVSAFLVWMIQGEYNVSLSTEDQNVEEAVRLKRAQSFDSIWEQVRGMTWDGMKYLTSSYFGAIVLMKPMLTLAYGACDVLNLAFAEMDSHGRYGNTNHDSGTKLGLLFAMVGIGCLLGPIAVEPFVHPERPMTAQFYCLVGFVLSTIGYTGWSIPGSPFWSICLFGLIRGGGSCVVWVNSTLLLQKFSSEKALGRVLAIDGALALLGEAASALLCGVIMDQYHFSAYQVSYLLAVLSLANTIIWGWYHFSGRGAGKYRPVYQKIANTEMEDFKDEPQQQEGALESNQQIATFGKQIVGPPRAAKCCGYCCDMRRATVILSLWLLTLNTINFTLYLGLTSFITAEEDAIDDDYFLNTVKKGYTTESLTSGVGIITNTCSLLGGLSYNTKLVGVNVVWTAIETIIMIFIFISMTNDLSDYLEDSSLSLFRWIYFLSTSLVLFCMYPMVSFIREVNAGILTPETYHRQGYCCCCMKRHY